MYCVYNGCVCVMVQNAKTGEYKYITEKTWLKMDEREKAQYTI